MLPAEGARGSLDDITHDLLGDGLWKKGPT